MKERKDFNWWCKRAWIKFGLLISLSLLVVILIYYRSWNLDMKILAGMAMLIPIHVIEEWVFPGGFHYQYNISIYNSKYPNRYPMCRASDMFTNLVTTIFYIVLLIISACQDNVVRPGILMGTFIFCCLELFAHTFFGIKMYLRFKNQGKSTIYGPGSITAYFGFVPLGVLSMYSLLETNINGIDWAICFALLAFIAIVCILIPETILKKRSEKYAFDNAGYFQKFIDKQN